MKEKKDIVERLLEEARIELEASGFPTSCHDIMIEAAKEIYMLRLQIEWEKL